MTFSPGYELTHECRGEVQFKDEQLRYLQAEVQMRNAASAQLSSKDGQVKTCRGSASVHLLVSLDVNAIIFHAAHLQLRHAHDQCSDEACHCPSP